MVYGFSFDSGGGDILIKFVRPIYWITAIIHTFSLLLFLVGGYNPSHNMVGWYMVELFMIWWVSVFIISHLEVKNENKNI